MEKTEMYIMSGNYFTERYAYMLANTVSKLSSSCHATYEGKEVSLKSNYEITQISDVIPGKRVKITCINSEYQQALSDLNMVRKLIEHDFTTTVESN